jgi:hypothetical protein
MSWVDVAVELRRIVVKNKRIVMITVQVRTLLRGNDVFCLDLKKEPT